MHRVCLTVIAFVTAVSSAHGQSAAGHLALGDRQYAAFDGPGALDRYEMAARADSTSFEAFWKASRSAMDIGSYHPDAARRREFYARAERYSRRAVALNPRDAEARFSLARALGKAALAQRPRGRVKYGSEVREHALECLKLNPRHSGCLHVMGMWNAEVMRLNGVVRLIARNMLGGRTFASASWKEAVRYMEEAVSATPSRIAHRVDLAEVYRDVGDKTKARAAYEAALRLPVSDINDKHYQEQARRGLTALQLP